MPDVENVDCVTFHCEHYAIDMRFAPVEQIPHFEGKLFILPRKRTAFGHFGQRGDRPLQSLKTSAVPFRPLVVTEAIPKCL